MRLTNCLFVLISVIMLTNACKTKPVADNSSIIINSVIKQYVETVERISMHTDERQLWQRYIDKDTAWFIQLGKEIEEWKGRVKSSKWDVPDTALSALQADEAYKFNFLGSFEAYQTRITIYRNKEDYKLKLLQYGDAIVDLKKKTWDRSDTLIIHKSFEKSITAQQWDSLIAKIVYADFWGMQQFNLNSGLDGSSWRMHGFCKDDKYGFSFSNGNRPRQHYVYRWSPEHSAFKDICLYIVQLSGEKLSLFDENNY